MAENLVVFFEIYWVLFSFYKKDKQELARILTDILAMTFVELQERKVFEQAVLILPTTNYDLEDAFNLVYAKANQAQTFVLMISG